MYIYFYPNVISFIPECYLSDDMPNKSIPNFYKHITDIVPDYYLIHTLSSYDYFDIIYKVRPKNTHNILSTFLYIPQLYLIMININGRSRTL